jgi:hypothetical protein
LALKKGSTRKFAMRKSARIDTEMITIYFSLFARFICNMTFIYFL